MANPYVFEPFSAPDASLDRGLDAGVVTLAMERSPKSIEIRLNIGTEFAR
jgi:hypothetical protein